MFTRRGERFVASDLARGPWDSNAQHGGAPAALLMRALELLPNPEELALARVTYELLRPVPLSELEVRSEVVRSGRRAQLLEGSILDADGLPLVRARALRLRPAEFPGAAASLSPDGPEGATVKEYPGRGTQFATDAIEVAFVTGAFSEPGPATAWFRFRHPLVAGEQPSPLQLLAAAADFGNSVGSALPWDRYSFINPDLTIYVEREPTEEWVCVEAQTVLVARGVPVAASTLYDGRGRVGRAIQALLVDERPPTSGGTP